MSVRTPSSSGVVRRTGLASGVLGSLNKVQKVHNKIWKAEGRPTCISEARKVMLYRYMVQAIEAIIRYNSETCTVRSKDRKKLRALRCKYRERSV